MTLRPLNSIRMQFSKERREARKDTKELLSSATRKGKESIGSIIRQAIPVLDRGIYLSENTGVQEMKILKKKEKLAKNLTDMSRMLLDRCEKRKKDVSKQITAIQKRMSGNPFSELTEEEKLILEEEKVLKHLERESRKIKLAFYEKRKHDIKPLLLKVNHITKILYFEEKANIVNPNILKEFMIYEDSILKKIERKEEEDDILDEFKTIQQLISSLKKESRVLLREYDRRKKRKDKRHIKKRVNEIIAETLMLENILHMIDMDSMIDKKFRNNSKKIYNLLEWVRNVEKEEERALNE